MQKKKWVQRCWLIVGFFVFLFFYPPTYSVPFVILGCLIAVLFFGFPCRAEQNDRDRLSRGTLARVSGGQKKPKVLGETRGDVGRRLAESQGKNRCRVGVQPATTFTCLRGFCSQASVKHYTGLIIHWLWKACFTLQHLASIKLLKKHFQLKKNLQFHFFVWCARAV